MRAFATFAIAWFLSMVAAQALARQLAILFGTRDEFIFVMFIIGAFAVASLAVLTMAFIAGTGTRPIDIGGGIALLLALFLITGLLAFGMARNNWARPTTYDMQIIAEIVLPSILIVVIQWWFLRRFRRNNEDQL